MKVSTGMAQVQFKRDTKATRNGLLCTTTLEIMYVFPTGLDTPTSVTFPVGTRYYLIPIRELRQTIQPGESPDASDLREVEKVNYIHSQLEILLNDDLEQQVFARQVSRVLHMRDLLLHAAIDARDNLEKHQLDLFPS